MVAKCWSNRSRITTYHSIDLLVLKLEEFALSAQDFQKQSPPLLSNLSNVEILFRSDDSFSHHFNVQHTSYSTTNRVAATQAATASIKTASIPRILARVAYEDHSGNIVQTVGAAVLVAADLGPCPSIPPSLSSCRRVATIAGFSKPACCAEQGQEEVECESHCVSNA
jgi:hypothetical protein